MASKLVSDAFATMLASNWTHTPITGLNIDVTPPADGSAFLVCQFPVAHEEQISLGAPGTRVFREYGSAHFALCIPIGAGLDPFEQWIDDLRAAFRGVQFGTASATKSAVNTWAPSPPVTDSQSDLGSYFEISFAVPYYSDLIG